MMSQIHCKQSIKIEMTGWFKHYFPGKTCLVPRFFTGERVGQRGFLQVLVTGIVTNLKQKIPSQITGKIMFKPTGRFYSYRLFTGNLLHHNPACIIFLKVLFQMIYLEQNE